MIIQSECAGPLCQMITRYEWSMYNKNQSEDSNHWVRIANLDDKILSKPNSPNFVLPGVLEGGGHSLEQGKFYRIHVAAFVNAERVKQGDIMFVTNSPPHTDVPGGCKLSPREGFALSSDFLVNCSGWHDEDSPLSFTYRWASYLLGSSSNVPAKRLYCAGKRIENTSIAFLSVTGILTNSSKTKEYFYNQILET